MEEYLLEQFQDSKTSSSRESVLYTGRQGGKAFIEALEKEIISERTKLRDQMIEYYNNNKSSRKKFTFDK